MEEKRWESCNAEALLEEFFSQDDLRQLALSTGELLDCPLLVLDDTFHVAAYRMPHDFSDGIFQSSVRCGEVSYEVGAISAKIRYSQRVGQTMSSCRTVPIGGALRPSSARVCALAV